jgi:predicted amidophosphoribosyltransferase
VPVPAHPARRRSRGFNQAALLAHEIAAICELEVHDCLVRDSGVAPQATLSRAERLMLPRDSIRVESIKPEAKKRTTIRKSLAELPTKVVLLDDVTTTGVTLEVCASAIRERYPVGSLTKVPIHRMDVQDLDVPQLDSQQMAIGALTFASTSAHPARPQDLYLAGNLK